MPDVSTIKLKKDTLRILREKKQDKTYDRFLRELIIAPKPDPFHDGIEKKLIQLETNILTRMQNVIFRLDQIERRLNSLENLKVNNKTYIETAKIEPEIKVIEPKTKQLPSFLEGNPWVEILKRRGIEVEPEY